ncbi:hypothetical protein HOA92_06405 [archaeon]|jgi:hypothetical protein|nr:hypothetical protein [archaeon]MBT6762643.1 hypothetical protein [archaeon]
MFDAQNQWKKLKRLPASFTGNLHYDMKTGLITDYQGMVAGIGSVYSIYNRLGLEKTGLNANQFITNILTKRTYHSFLEDRMDEYNNWFKCEVDDAHVGQISLASTGTSLMLKKGASSMIRPIAYREFMDVFYSHENAVSLNRDSRNLFAVAKKSFDEILESDGSLSFNDLDHVSIVEALGKIDSYFGSHGMFCNPKRFLERCDIPYRQRV